MERTLEVACEGTASSFAISKLSRATLYGSKRRVPVDAEGRPCRAAALTRDGRFLLPPGSTATLYLDNEGNAVERAEITSAGKHQDAQRNGGQPEAATAAEVLDCAIRQVYALTPVAIGEPLEGLLTATGMCRLPSDPAFAGAARFLVKNDAGYFLLVGERSGFGFVGPDQVDLSIPESDGAWDDLDFAML